MAFLELPGGTSISSTAPQAQQRWCLFVEPRMDFTTVNLFPPGRLQSHPLLGRRSLPIPILKERTSYSLDTWACMSVDRPSLPRLAHPQLSTATAIRHLTKSHRPFLIRAASSRNLGQVIPMYTWLDLMAELLALVLKQFLNTRVWQA
jgi:hypothetical protein